MTTTICHRIANYAPHEQSLGRVDHRDNPGRSPRFSRAGSSRYARSRSHFLRRQTLPAWSTPDEEDYLERSAGLTGGCGVASAGGSAAGSRSPRPSRPEAPFAGWVSLFAQSDALGAGPWAAFVSQ